MERLRQQLGPAQVEVAFDSLTRQLYATDASLYQVEPDAVAFPRMLSDAQSLLRAAAAAEVPVICRGAGTGLVGGAIGAGLVIDFARHNRRITQLDPERRTVRVEPGVVLDQLNSFLKPHGFAFGPDVATSSRATLGGMIANNSSGARVPIYGTTADHVATLDLLLADGRVVTVGSGCASLGEERAAVRSLISRISGQVAQRMPAGLAKRWPGYALDRWLREPDNLAALLCGSEGTLAAIVSAELKVVPLPRDKGLGIIFFTSVADAMQATVSLLDLKPAAIEHIDRVLFDQTKGRRQFQAARDLLQLDTQPCESILMVELYDDVPDRLQIIAQRQLGVRTLLLRRAADMNLVWGLRKAGLSLLTSRKGPAKPVTCIEDTAVRPEQLPAYVQALQSIMQPLNLEVCYYGHAASGLLHVRPVLDLHHPSDRQKLRLVSDQVSALVRQFRGSLAGEHGVGMARSEYMRSQLGDDVFEAMRAIKQLFDPRNLLNPGKILDDGRYAIDTHLRLGHPAVLELPFTPVLAFAGRDESFLANLEQCNGCGGCRKEAPTMCPTFAATGLEIMSTRGRANAIRAVLEGRAVSRHGLAAPELEAALSDCLGCKACTVECPSNVNMSLLKAELLHARQRKRGVTLRERLLSSVDRIAQAACLSPRLANGVLRWPAFRRLLTRTVGISSQRSLLPFAHPRFDHWFRRRHTPPAASPRGSVLLWDDTFTRYHEPHIGMAAVRVLEAAGFAVTLLRGRQCCGRPAFSQGRLDHAARLGRHNVQLLSAGSAGPDASPSARPPIIFLEPSCYSMFVEDYRELGIAHASEVAGRCFLFEHFVDGVLLRDPLALCWRERPGPTAIHAHCHAKALTQPDCLERLAARVPGANVRLLDTGCCGMAGAFGMLESKLELSAKVAQPLLHQLRQLPADARIVASGTSCRQQIAQLAGRHPWHMAEYLADALAGAK